MLSERIGPGRRGSRGSSPLLRRPPLLFLFFLPWQKREKELGKQEKTEKCNCHARNAEKSSMFFFLKKTVSA